MLRVICSCMSVYLVGGAVFSCGVVGIRDSGLWLLTAGEVSLQPAEQHNRMAIATRGMWVLDHPFRMHT